MARGHEAGILARFGRRELELGRGGGPGQVVGLVAADAMPLFGEARVPAQRYVQGTEIAPLMLPAATGGQPAAGLHALVAVQEPTRTLTPYGGLAPSEGGARGYRLGACFQLDRRSS